MNKLVQCLLVAALFLLPGAALGQMKIGFINSDQLKERLPEIKAAQQQLELLQQQRAQEDEDRQAKMAQMEENYRKQEMLLSEARKAEMRSEYEAEGQRLIEFRQNTQEELMKRNFDLHNPIFERINTAIKAVAEEEGYDYVLDAGSAGGAVVFAKDDYDLTDKLLARLQSTPVKAGGN
ncbi:MAG: OmpH family outer membrane protein [Candidatus Handelsmanbacteria bacterium]|nr:OmpH family outer membrane protein [Candidatus Handelsmanbacteria bacterium]